MHPITVWLAGPGQLLGNLLPLSYSRREGSQQSLPGAYPQALSAEAAGAASEQQKQFSDDGQMTDFFARKEDPAPSSRAETGMRLHALPPHMGMHWLPAELWGHLCEGASPSHPRTGCVRWLGQCPALQLRPPSSPHPLPAPHPSSSHLSSCRRGKTLYHLFVFRV